MALRLISDYLLGCCIGSVVTSLWFMYFQLKKIADKYTKDEWALYAVRECFEKLDKIENIMHIEMNGKEALQEIERILRE